MSNPKPLVIYHANCADGFGAAFAAWLKFGSEAEYVPMQYGAPPIDSMIGKDKEVYILDFSFPKPQMEHLFRVAKRVVWLDHHKTAFEMWCGGKLYDFSSNEGGEDGLKIQIRLNNAKSGATIAWEYFHPDKETPMLIKHIDDYDRWQFKIEGTKEFNKVLWSYAPWNFEHWETAFLPCNDFEVEGDFGSLLYACRLDEGAAILRAHEANVQAVVKGASRKCKIRGLKDLYGHVETIGLAANCPPHLQSDVGHALAVQSETYGLLWYINKEGKCLCSLRSNGGYDVSTIAKAFGGGGHKNAAGFEISIETLLEWIK